MKMSMDKTFVPVLLAENFYTNTKIKNTRFCKTKQKTSFFARLRSKKKKIYQILVDI